MEIIIFTAVLSFLYLIAKLLSKASSKGKESGLRTFIIWISVSSIVIFFFWRIVTENARWAEKECRDNSAYNISKTVEAEGFYAHSTSEYDFLPYIIDGTYSYVELLNFKGEGRVKRVYLAEVGNPYCQENYFETNNGTNFLLKKLPEPPIPDKACVAIENTNIAKSRYEFDVGNLRWVGGKGTKIQKVTDTETGEVISTWTGFAGRAYFKSFSCTIPKSGTLYERTIMLNRVAKGI